MEIVRKVAFELGRPWRVEELRAKALEAYPTAKHRTARSGLPPKQIDEQIRRLIYEQVKKAGEEMDALPFGGDFRGVILNLVGDTLPGNTSCTRDTPTTDGLSSVGTYENTGFTCQCWVYAEGGTSTRAGIELDPDSQLRFLPSASFNFRSNLYAQPQPTDFRLQRWRELYQAGP